MYRVFVIVAILILTSNFSFSQGNVTKKEFLKILKGEYFKENKNSSSSWYWYAANMDSGFYRSDTIIFYSDTKAFYEEKDFEELNFGGRPIHNYYNLKICNYFVWVFSPGEHFNDYDYLGCGEDHSIILRQKKNLFGEMKLLKEYNSISFIEEIPELIIKVKYGQRKSEKYKVVNAGKFIHNYRYMNPQATEIFRIVLVRLKNNH